MTDTVTVRRATPDDTDTLIPVLAAAFHAGPVADWLIPDPVERAIIYRAYFTAVLRHALTHGHVDTTRDRTGVAIWYPRPQPPPPPDPDHLAALGEATGAYAPVFALLDALLDTSHPVEPHHHLAYLAVHPDRQRRGIGAALLDGYHRRLDTKGLPAYLEATNLRNRALYHRLGYRTGTPIHITDGPTIWRMWRPGKNVLPTGFLNTATPLDCSLTDGLPT
ncbi:GNAT family N-acetyltransferase [Micromonospora sp. SH-82]|uniref:GNAT family N-acetyltransferase n=1 Tax=Micromonospora sp. SH-82 TaxID=3132938 RepID=UPI003EB9934A